MDAVAILLLAGSFAIAGALQFSYNAQDEWGGVCNTGNRMRQSPINIVTSSLESSNSLVSLNLTSWDAPRSGVFSNTGATAQFFLSGDQQPTATLVNHRGSHSVFLFHFHWGRNASEGSEHRVDGQQAALEIHIGALKQNDNNTLYSVLGVLVDVASSNDSVSDFWSMLDVNAISALKANVSVENFRIDKLLPSSLDYWYYEGSFTTPECFEVVSWFVLKERIKVPAAFLEQLRRLEANAQSDLLAFNFRTAQAIGKRTVFQYSSTAQSISAASSTTSILLAVTLYNTIIVKLF